MANQETTNKMQQIMAEAMAKVNARTKVKMDKLSKTPVTAPEKKAVVVITAPENVEEMSTTPIDTILAEAYSEAEVGQKEDKPTLADTLAVLLEEAVSKNTELQKEIARLKAELKGKKTTAVQVTRNMAKDGIEIRFSGIPEQSVIDNLKATGFYFSFKQKMWYSKYDEAKLKFAQSL
jgi:uncharacterized small protein (DUF1192 family)